MLRIEFKQGRGFTETEVNDARKVAVVNETFVRKYFSRGDNPMGHRVRLARAGNDERSGEGAMV